MRKEQILGQLRELLTAGAAAFVTFRSIDGFDPQAAIAAIVAVIALIWGIWEKQSWGVVASLVRKAFSAAGSALVTYGIMTGDQNAAIAGVLGPAIALLTSFRANGKEDPAYTGV